ncbi:hypothetical protein D3C79_880340 [compost metagenome]
MRIQLTEGNLILNNNLTHFINKINDIMEGEAIILDLRILFIRLACEGNCFIPLLLDYGLDIAYRHKWLINY